MYLLVVRQTEDDFLVILYTFCKKCEICQKCIYSAPGILDMGPLPNMAQIQGGCLGKSFGHFLLNDSLYQTFLVYEVQCQTLSYTQWTQEF